jgi:hypothetical protein
MSDELSDDPVWIQMAEFLCDSGYVGQTLLHELRARFPHARRDDVYRAIAMAWTYHQAGHLADYIALEVARTARTPRI